MKCEFCKISDGNYLTTNNEPICLPCVRKNNFNQCKKTHKYIAERLFTCESNCSVCPHNEELRKLESNNTSKTTGISPLAISLIIVGAVCLLSLIISIKNNITYYDDSDYDFSPTYGDYDYSSSYDDDDYSNSSSSGCEYEFNGSRCGAPVGSNGVFCTKHKQELDDTYNSLLETLEGLE